MYSQLTKDILQRFRSICGTEAVGTSREQLEPYSRDETEDLEFYPEVVLRPSSGEEISQIAVVCNEHRIPLTPRGAGTGLSGGALPTRGGVLLSLEKMNRILSIDENNYQAVVEPGVITQHLQEQVMDHGLFYPPDPASRGSCFIGGNVAENSGGPRAVKYGVVKDYVLNLEVVLADGHKMWTGANVLKNATGYNLTQLFVGSEGTLGIVTKIVLRLIPYPPYNALLLVPFNQMEDAARAVAHLLKKGLDPSALEFMERDAIDLSLKYLDDISIEVSDETEAQLLIELDGHQQDDVMEQSEKAYELLQAFDIGEILFTEHEAQKEELWKLRRRVGEAVKRHSVYKEEDTVVPRYELPNLLRHVKSVGEKYGFRSVCYGHAGDGNLHVNILREDHPEEYWNEQLPQAIRELFQKVKELGGTLSGEHGIGHVQRQYMDIFFDEKSLNLQRNLKAIFDPHNIMNPDKIFPAQNHTTT